MSDLIIVLTTAGSEKNANNIAETLVQLQLAACVNIVPKITSVYRWGGKVDRAEEWLLLIKTRGTLFMAVQDAIKQVHTYDVPECITVAIENGSKEYLTWLWSSVKT